MILARIRVTGTCAVLTEWKEVPKGIRGAEVAIVYEGPTWDSLQKTVVFKGCVTRDVVNAGELVTIPPECVERAGAPLKVGIFGTDAGNNLAIPTLWADLGRVRDATDPSGDESTVEALPVWAQILALIGDLDDLATEAKATLVAAINEAATKGGGSVSEEEVWAIVDRYLQEHPPVFAETDPTVPSWAKQPQKPSYSAQEVGAESAGTAAAAVSGHNTSADAHNDLRLELKAISNRLNAFLDSDDQTLDELSEIVAYITSNKSLIDAITTSKVSVSDIVDNLTTNVGHRPLSAAQGVVLKGLIDTVSRSLSNYQPKGDYLDREELPEAVNDALARAKESGEFDGEDGVDGKPGKDGVSVTHVWDGTVLKVTSASGTSSADLRGAPGEPGKDGTSVAISSITGSDESGGENVVIFSNGRPLVIKNGLDGKPGKDGADGKDGVGIKKITTEETEIGPYTGRHIDIELTNGGGASFNIYNGIHGHDGADGVGIDYVDTFGPTVDGYTAVRLHLTNGNTESFEVYHGEKGEPGKDGTSVTVKSVSESNADGGNNVVSFSDGKTLTVKNGRKGSTGDKGEDGVGIESVEQTFAPTADDAYNVITMKLTDGKTKQFSVKNGSKGSTGATGKTAYEYAKDGGYAGTEAQFAEKMAAEFPTKLPNPNGIHINGTYYDGSEHVSVNIEGGSGSADMGASGGEPGYVKRREFYDEPDKTVADNVSVSSGQYSWISHDIVADHKAATVVYDGVTYECPINFKESITEYGDESYFYIGNFQNNAPEYPFFIFGYINSDAATVNVGSGTHTVSVTLKAILKKIDRKYLPDDIGGVTKTLFYERDSDADGGIDDYGYIPALEASVTYEVEWGGEVYTDTAKKVADVLGVSPDDTVTLPDGTEYQPYDDVVWGDLSYFVGGEPTMPIRMEYMIDGSTMLFNMSGVDGVRHVKIYVVEKAPSSGGVSSWNDLTDRPFGTETFTIDPTFDGDITGRETVQVDANTYAVRVTPQYVSVEEMIGAIMVLNMGGAEQPVPLTAENTYDGNLVFGLTSAVVLIDGNPIVFSVPEETTLQGITLTAGTWFMCMPGQMYVQSLSCLTPGEYEVVNKIDKKYLPDIGGGFNDEPFVIEDPSTPEPLPLPSNSSRMFLLSAALTEQMKEGLVRVQFDYTTKNEVNETENGTATVNMLTISENLLLGWFGTSAHLFQVSIELKNGLGLLCVTPHRSNVGHNGIASGYEYPSVVTRDTSSGYYAIYVDDNGNLGASKII